MTAPLRKVSEVALEWAEERLQKAFKNPEAYTPEQMMETAAIFRNEIRSLSSRLAQAQKVVAQAKAEARLELLYEVRNLVAGYATIEGFSPGVIGELDTMIGRAMADKALASFSPERKEEALTFLKPCGHISTGAPCYCEPPAPRPDKPGVIRAHLLEKERNPAAQAEKPKERCKQCGTEFNQGLMACEWPYCERPAPDAEGKERA